MALRVYWPATRTADDGVLLGWWLPQAGPDHSMDVVVAVVVPTASSGMSERIRELTAAEDRFGQLGALTVLGSCGDGATMCSESCGKLRIYADQSKVRVDFDTGPYPCHVHVVEYQHPPARGQALRYLLSEDRTSWCWPGSNGHTAVYQALDAAASLDDPRLGCGVGCVRCISLLCVLVSVISHFIVYVLPTQSRVPACSAFASQCAVRLSRQSQWLGHFMQPSDMREKCARGPFSNRLSVISSVTSVFCDVCLGVLAFIILGQCSEDQILKTIASAHSFVYRGSLVPLVSWLMGAPANFKLNAELTSAFGSLCMSLFLSWEALVSYALASDGFFLLMRCGKLCPLFGLSFLVAFCMDLLACLLLPLFLVHICVSTVWRYYRRGLWSLILLFRGKRYNSVRLRVDHHAFTIEQLLIGVVTLSVYAFLFTTFLLTHLCFAVVWLVFSWAYSALSVCLHALNDIRWFMLLAVFADPFLWNCGPRLSLQTSPHRQRHEQMHGDSEPKRQRVSHVYLTLELLPLRWPQACFASGESQRIRSGTSMWGCLSQGLVASLRHGLKPDWSCAPLPGDWRTAFQLRCFCVPRA